MRPAFTPLLPVTPHKSLYTNPCTPPRRPRAPSRPAAHLHQPDNVPPPPQDSYIQCVECLAVYHIEPEEVEGTPRVVACSACLHEWLASDADLLWGHDEAVAALAAAARRRVEGSAFVAARGVERERQEKLERQEQEKMEIQEGQGRMEKQRREEAQEQNESNNETRWRQKRVGKKGNGKHEDDDDDEHFNVFVGNLSFRATEEDLYRAFSGYGAVLSCQVPADASGASRGFGFVEMRSKESALRAIESLQGSSILGRDVSLNEAKPRRERERDAPRWRGRRKARFGERREEYRSGRVKN